MQTITNTPARARRFPLTEGLLLLVAVFWGTSYGLTKTALLYTGVATFLALRFALTFLCLLPFMLRDFRQQRNQDWFVALPTGGILAAIFLCEVAGIFHTSAANAAFLISLALIFTAFLESFLARRGIPWQLWGTDSFKCVGCFLAAA